MSLIRTISKHGNSKALVIDPTLLELLQINEETPLEITTDGKRLVITPVDQERRKKLQKALQRTHKRYGRALKKLAE